MRNSIILLLVIFFCRFQAGTAQQRSMADTVATDAAWCWFSDPRAVYYKGRHEKIYFAYINSKGDVVVNSKDHRTGVQQSFTLHKQLQIDDHNVPSLLFLPDGTLMAFYTEHNGRFFIRQTKKPEDISEWSDERIMPFGKRISYSHPVMLSGEHNRIYVFFRGDNWEPCFSVSDDLGKSWTNPEVLIAGEGLKLRSRPYLKVSSDNKHRIDFLFTDGHPATEALNSVYHIYYERGGFYKTNGGKIGGMESLPVKRNTIIPVYDAKKTGARAWIEDIALNKHNKPVILYTRYPQPSDHRFHYAFWDGNAWNDREICRAGGWMPQTAEGKVEREQYYSGGMTLDHQNPANFYLARQVNGIFEVERWQLKGKAFKSRPLTSGSSANNMRPFIIQGTTGRNARALWMQGHYEHYTKFETRLLLN